MMLKTVLLAAGFGLSATAASALTAAVDLNPATTAIENTRTVTVGTSFTVDIVMISPYVAEFDTFAFDTQFNNAGPVLGLTNGGPSYDGLPALGTIAGTAFHVTDVSNDAPVVPPVAGAPLSTGASSPPVFPYTSWSGQVGACAVIGPGLPCAPGQTALFGDGPIPPGLTFSLFSLTFDALTPGTSSILPVPGVDGGPTGFLLRGSPAGGASLAADGLAVSSSVGYYLPSATVTVTPAAIPLPAGALLLVSSFAVWRIASRRGRAVA